jgi:hypothetical protein
MFSITVVWFFVTRVLVVTFVHNVMYRSVQSVSSHVVQLTIILYFQPTAFIHTCHMPRADSRLIPVGPLSHHRVLQFWRRSFLFIWLTLPSHFVPSSSHISVFMNCQCHVLYPIVPHITLMKLVKVAAFTCVINKMRNVRSETIR